MDDAPKKEKKKKAGDCKRWVCVCVWLCMTKSKSGCRVVVAEHFGLLVNDQQEKKRKEKKEPNKKRKTIHDFSMRIKQQTNGKKKMMKIFSVH